MIDTITLLKNDDEIWVYGLLTNGRSYLYVRGDRYVQICEDDKMIPFVEPVFFHDDRASWDFMRIPRNLEYDTELIYEIIAVVKKQYGLKFPRI